MEKLSAKDKNKDSVILKKRTYFKESKNLLSGSDFTEVTPKILKRFAAAD